MNLSTRTSLTVLAALCGAAAIAPAAARATTITTYNAEIQAQADWSLTQHQAGPDWSFSSGGWFTWNTLVDAGQLRFVDGYLSGVTVHGKGRQLASGTGTAEHHSEQTGTQGGACSLDNEQHDGAAAMVGKPHWAEWNDEVAAVAISESDVSLDWKCDGDISPTLPSSFGSEPLDHDDTLGNRPLDAVFTIPKEVVGFGRIIQNVQGPPAASAGYCPEKWYDGVEKCSFRWKGTVTLTKTGERTLEAPAAPAGGASPPSAPAAPASDEPIELAPLVLPTSSATTDAKASKVSFAATCPSGCSGSAALSVPGAARGSAVGAAVKPVARMAFKVKAGTNRTITLKLPAKARRALRRAWRGTLRVALKKPGRLAVVKTLRVEVPRR